MTQDFLFIYIILIHFLADFGLQTHEQALNKSSSMLWLVRHTAVYSMIWMIAVLPIFPFKYVCLFTLITFAAHTITDYFTSRISKPFFQKLNYHDGFVVVGFDQMLHYLQLYYTFKYLL